MRIRNSVPQGRERQTLAISIKEMLVSGGWRGGGGFYPHFSLSSNVEIFACHFLRLRFFGGVPQ